MKHFLVLTNVTITLVLIWLFFSGNIALFVLTYIAECLIISARTLMGNSEKRAKAILLIIFFFLLSVQITFYAISAFAGSPLASHYYIQKAFGILAFFVPLIINRYISAGKYASFYLPSVTEVATVSFAELRGVIDTVNRMGGKINETRKKVTRKGVKELLRDLPRHDPFRYINNESLTDAYFEKARETLSDPSVYIIISRTGSAASELISVFTQKEYNHASLSFDRNLETIISYNGGERVYPPGLNYEMLEFFNKTKGSSVMVYRLPATSAQKLQILGKIEEINREGSAYNTMGLVLKYSHKPNIMFCSQFVYNMLKLSGLAYFTKRAENVKPTDLIELDYYKKLEFAYEIKFNKEG
ncbi:hypothetical protein FACS189490_00580 [Clostridia bacterium]|nr:hypothetical protein FACS189490_00580 [Clostridia bacterium]